MVSVCFLMGNIVYNLLDNGIANVLETQTLKHGTNLFNNFSIRLNGGDPTHGRKSSGSTSGWCEDDTTNFFYVFKDKEYTFLDVSEDSLSDSLIVRISMFFLRNKVIGPWLFSLVHTGLSGYNFTTKILLPESDSSIIKIGQTFLGIIGGISCLILSPTLKFRFSTIDSNKLQNDPAYHGAAYRTTKKIEAWRLGPLGSLIVGINKNWPSRVKTSPINFVVGIAQLTTAVAIISICFSIVVANPYLLIPVAAGALLA